MVEKILKEKRENYRQISLVKGFNVYVFRYKAGEEFYIIKAIEDSARDLSCGLDRFDALVLSFNVIKNSGKKGLEGFVC
jgi:hypothetical protein